MDDSYPSISERGSPWIWLGPVLAIAIAGTAMGIFWWQRRKGRDDEDEPPRRRWPARTIPKTQACLLQRYRQARGEQPLEPLRTTESKAQLHPTYGDEFPFKGSNTHQDVAEVRDSEVGARLDGPFQAPVILPPQLAKTDSLEERRASVDEGPTSPWFGRGGGRLTETTPRLYTGLKL